MLKNYMVVPKTGSAFVIKEVLVKTGENAIVVHDDMGLVKAVIPISEVYGVFSDEVVEQIRTQPVPEEHAIPGHPH